MSQAATSQVHPKIIAREALSRGWLNSDSLWEIAQRHARKENLSHEEIFSPTLSPEQIQTLSSAIENSQEKNDTIKTKEIPMSSISNLDNLPTEVHYALSQKNSDTLFQKESPPIQIHFPKYFVQSDDKNRYQFGEQIGEGGVGRVLSSFDQASGRTIAVKMLKDEVNSPVDTLRFLKEARITAQLEHPSIIPVYDIGQTPKGRPFYTMRIVKKLSLKEVLQNAEKEDKKSAWPLSRLCSIFVQVCRAVSYAHSQGVIHRDLKPENILLGDYGEVYVADWGIAKILSETESNITPQFDDSDPVGLTQAGSVLGTIGYMAPEQLTGNINQIDHRADLFSLGVILYWILTGQEPFSGPSTIAVAAATIQGTMQKPREIFPNCPLVLEDLCLQLLSIEPEKRPSTASFVVEEIEAFLEGSKEKERRKQEAYRLVKRAQKPKDLYRKLGDKQKRLQEEAKQILQDVKPWEAIEKKRPGWKRIEEAQKTEIEQASALAEVIEIYAQALGYDPESKLARQQLAALYWMRACEVQENEPARIYYESLVKEYDSGHYIAILNANARLSLDSNPQGAQVWAYQYVKTDFVLLPTKEQFLGNTPLQEIELAPGSYLLRIKCKGYRDTHYPVLCRRAEHHQTTINLYTENEIGKDFVYVPGGNFLLGGDPQAVDSLPREESFVDDFAMARFPVTFSEYMLYLNDLQKAQSKELERRLPGDTSDGLMVKQNSQQQWVPFYEVIIEGEGRKYCTKSQVGDVPVFCVDWFDSLAYIRWKNQKDQVNYHLPSELEWEKAARGVDGRQFPWGNQFDPTFCKMRESRPGVCQAEASHTYPIDKSPYGVRGMAGGVRSWIVDIHNSLTTSESLREVEPPVEAPRDEAGLRVIRGGCWSLPGHYCRGASRALNFMRVRYATTGFRLAKKLKKPPR